MSAEEYALCSMGLSLLMDNLGEVEAERFVSLMNRNAGDYTEWRRDNLYRGVSLTELAERARKTGEALNGVHSPRV